MIIEIGGGEGGFKEYLETGRKHGRELHRDRLDQRIPLFGDLNVFEIATSSYKTKGNRYDHVTLSFSEHHVSDAILQIAVDEFREHVFAAWPESQRHRIALYAEAHRPRILSYVNSESGEEVERLIHIHIGIGKRDLQTGKFVELLGHLGPESDNLKFIDAFQESFNTRHGFASPKDNPKITPSNAIDTLARYRGAKPDALGSFNARKAELEIRLQKKIINRDIVTWDGFGKLLAEFGVVSKMNAGKFNECYRIKPMGTDRAMRLSGTFFGQHFISIPTQEKINIISNKAKTAYLEQMQPKKEPIYVTETLNKWNNFTARELRFLHKSSRFYREVYLPADAPTRRQILDNMERENHGITSTHASQLRKVTAARSRLPAMPVRGLDGIQTRSEMLLFGHARLDVRNRSASRDAGISMRQPDQSRIDALKKLVEITQPSSVLNDVQRTLREKYEQAENQQKYAEIRRHLNCDLLLNELSHSHGVTQERYIVSMGNDGSQRIQCGSRSLSPNDFLTKELGLPWKEAAPILRRTYENQINYKVIQPRGKNQSSQLWKDFKQARTLAKAELSQRRNKFSVDMKAQRADLFARLANERRDALLGLTGANRKAAAAIQAYRSALEKSEFSAASKVQHQSIVAHYVPDLQAGWKQFLQGRAQAGNDDALIALRKCDDTWRDSRRQSAGISAVSQWTQDRQVIAQHSSIPILKTLAFTVALNGDVTYSHQGRALLRDEGRHIAVLDEFNEEGIVAGLMLAKEKFGTSLTLTGSDEFQRRVVALSVERGIAVQFGDPQLELLRIEIQNQLRKKIIDQLNADSKKIDLDQFVITELNQNSLLARYSTASQGIPIKAASDLNNPLTHEFGQRELISAKAWMESWAAENGSSIKSAAPGNGKVPFTILHIASDGIVLNQGRSVAIYPIPEGIDLRVGGQVVVNQNQTLEPAVERNKSRGNGKLGR